MAFNKIKEIFTGNDEKTDEDEEEFNTEEIIAGYPSKMILLEPRAFSESTQIADHLKSKCAVIVNLKRVTPDQAKRIVDFLYGTLYAIEGEIQKLGGGIFLCAPRNVNVEGKISDDQKEKSGKAKKGEEDQEDEFNW